MPTPASPDTNNFRCSACGRWFNTQAELSEHEVECRRAKTSTEAGRRTLEQDEREEHQKNDHDSTEQPFQHGTSQPKNG